MAYFGVEVAQSQKMKEKDGLFEVAYLGGGVTIMLLCEGGRKLMASSVLRKEARSHHPGVLTSMKPRN